MQCDSFQIEKKASQHETLTRRIKLLEHDCKEKLKKTQQKQNEHVEQEWGSQKMQSSVGAEEKKFRNCCQRKSFSSPTPASFSMTLDFWIACKWNAAAVGSEASETKRINQRRLFSAAMSINLNTSLMLIEAFTAGGYHKNITLVRSRESITRAWREPETFTETCCYHKLRFDFDSFVSSSSSSSFGGVNTRFYSALYAGDVCCEF